MSSDRQTRLAVLTLALLALCTCESSPEGSLPAFTDGGLARLGEPLSREQLYGFEGIFDLTRGSELFGSDVSVRTSPGTVSVLSDKDAGFAVLEAACLDTERVVVEGYWQYPTRTRSGLVRLFVTPEETARALCAGTEITASTPLTLAGFYGDGDVFPGHPLELTWSRELQPWRGRFLTVAHHGACEITDHCGVTPNTVETVRLAERAGANAMEVDVRVTRDQVPVLFHDPQLSAALTYGLFCNGSIAGSSLAELRANCSLKYGEAIPTLREALDTVLDETELEGVYLDMKVPEAVLPSARLASSMLDELDAQNAAAPGAERKIAVVIAITTDEVLAAWRTAKATLEAEGVRVPPCLVEYDPDLVLSEGCVAWGPTWTAGPQAQNVQELRAGGAATVYWTINQTDFIDEFLKSSHPDGIISSRSALLFHRYQMIGTPPPERGVEQ